MSQAELFGEDDSIKKRRQLLLASAGTGKTFRLANHFAGLLVAGVEPKQVLAATFTRKAAGEILDRVLKRLREGAEEGAAGEEARGYLLEAAQAVEPYRDSLSTGECAETLARLVRRIERFRVQTLDAFFISLSQLFAMELELAPEFAIGTAVQEVGLAAETVARVLDGLEDGERLELLRALVRGGASRKAQSALLEAVSEAENAAAQVGPDAWGNLKPLDGVDPAEVEAQVRCLHQCDVPVTAKGEPNKLFANAIDALRALVGDGSDPIDSSFFGIGLVEKVIAGDEKFARAPIPEDIAGAIQVLAQRAGEDAVNELLTRNEAMGSFLTKYARAEDNLRAEWGIYRFQDFSRALERGPAREQPEVWRQALGFRMDAKLSHLLLDEFQDTSAQQWRLLLPLAEEVLADGTEESSFFCVGDVKQSIYGWRGGEPRLLSRMHERHPGLEKEEMVENYRSSRVILDVVNQVFEGLADRMALAGEKRSAVRQAARRWSENFGPHEAKKDLPGEAHVWQVRAHEKDRGEVKMDPAVDLAVERVRVLHARHPDASIAILVRTAKLVPTLRYRLGKVGIEASDEGGNPLTDSLPVTWLLGLLQLADHPGDGIAALQVARSPFGPDLGLLPADAGSTDAQRRASEVSAELREELLHMGYGPFFQRRMARLTEDASAWDLRRLEQLVDLAEIHDAEPGLRPADFADEVRAKKVSDPSQARVKVMTIHASKGLEFDAVVLPELGRLWQLTPKGVLLESESEVAPPRVATMAPRADVAAQHPELEALYEGEKERQMVDELSGLYVALTRAVHSIDLIVSAPGKKSPSQSHGALVAEAFDGQIVGELTFEGDHEKVWSHADSTDAWAPVHEGRAKEPVEEHRLQLDPAPQEDAVRAPSSAGHSSESVRSLLSGSSGRGARFGTLVHSLFEDVEWLDQGPRADADLRASLGRVGAEDPELVDGALARFQEAMASEALVQLLTCPPGEVTVHNERSFEVQVEDEDGAQLRWRGFIDRLVLHREGGRVKSAQVIDYKTDAVASSDEVRAAHREQMEAYRSAVAALFGLPSSDVSCALVWLKDPSVAGVGAEVLEV